MSALLINKQIWIKGDSDSCKVRIFVALHHVSLHPDNHNTLYRYQHLSIKSII